MAEPSRNRIAPEAARIGFWLAVTALWMAALPFIGLATCAWMLLSARQRKPAEQRAYSTASV